MTAIMQTDISVGTFMGVERVQERTRTLTLTLTLTFESMASTGAAIKSPTLHVGHVLAPICARPAGNLCAPNSCWLRVSGYALTNT